MTLRPGDLLGLPALGEAPSDHVVLRYVLLILAFLCAALAARGRRRLLLAGGILFVEAVLVFWTASMARPYGLFEDAGVTRVAAEASTAALPGTDGALSGEPRSRSLPVHLVQWGISVERVIAGPTLLPLVIVPVLGLLIFLLWPRVESAPAAMLWLAFSTSEAAAVRGEGFLPGLWSHPGGSLALLVVAAAVLAVGRLRSRPLALTWGLGATLALVLLGPAGSVPPFAERLLAATFEQGPWLLLGAYGLARGAPAAAWSLVAGGGVLYGLGAGDPWATHAAYRMGLILAATAPALGLMRAAAAVLVSERACRAVATTPERLGLAALLALTLPGSFVARWNPAALDPAVTASRLALSRNLQPGLDWIRTRTSPATTCVASPDYAALVAVVGGRRVLRAPELWDPVDDQRRRRAERMLAAGREPDLLRRYQVGCVFFASSDVGWLETASRDALDRVPGLRLGFADAYTRVYVVTAATSAP